MADKQYKNTGSMHVRDKKSDKAPDMGGDFTIEDDVLEYVLNQARTGSPVTLEISGWNRQGRSGRFMSISVQTPYAVRGGNRGQAGSQRRGYSQEQEANYGRGGSSGGYQQRGSGGGYSGGRDVDNRVSDRDRGSYGQRNDTQQTHYDQRSFDQQKSSSHQRPLDQDERFNGDEYLGRNAGGAEHGQPVRKNKWD